MYGYIDEIKTDDLNGLVKVFVPIGEEQLVSFLSVNFRQPGEPSIDLYDEIDESNWKHISTLKEFSEVTKSQYKEILKAIEHNENKIGKRADLLKTIKDGLGK